MATIKEHVYAIQNILNQGAKSDDSRLSNSLIEHYLNTVRALLLKREINKKQELGENNYQSFCLELTPTTFFDCTCIPEEFGCTILRSKQPLPSYISSKYKPAIDVRFIDGTKVDRGSYTSYKKSNASLTSSSTPTWFIYNRYLYITHTLRLKTILVRGLWENPSKLESYSNCENSKESCYDPSDDDFPIDTSLVSPMYNLTLQHLTPAYQFPFDTENNARAATITQDQE